MLNMNMITLLIVGPALEVLLGKVRFVVLYLLAGLGGSVGSYILGPHNELGIGASGAIMGVLGAYIVVGLRRRLPIAPVAILLVINLALILGADSDTAARAIATYNDPSMPAEAIEELKDVYNKTFGYWSDHNYDVGDIARWVDNAGAIAHVRVHDQLQDWPRLILGRNLVESIEIDNGPHSMTRVQLRARLLNDAKSGNEVKRAEAIRMLKFTNEKGVLMALRSEPEPLGEMARSAFFEVMNPKATAESVPESPKAQSNDTPSFGGVNTAPR